MLRIILCPNAAIVFGVAEVTGTSGQHSFIASDEKLFFFFFAVTNFFFIMNRKLNQMIQRL